MGTLQNLSKTGIWKPLLYLRDRKSIRLELTYRSFHSVECVRSEVKVGFEKSPAAMFFLQYKRRRAGSGVLSENGFRSRTRKSRRDISGQRKVY